jgi:hypothetical protein
VSFQYVKAPFPDREVRARDALEMAVSAGVHQAEIDAVFVAHTGLTVFAWERLTNEQLAGLSASLRILAGFY